MLEELDTAFKEAVADNDIRVIILSGEGDHFSSGDDLGTPPQKEDELNVPTLLELWDSIKNNGNSFMIWASAGGNCPNRP